MQAGFEQLFDLSPDILGIIGFDGDFKHVNPAVEKMLGYTWEEILVQPFIELVHPEDRAATADEMKKITAGTVNISFENRYLCKDGSYKWLAWSITSLAEEGLLYAIGRDITESKRVEVSLRESVERYRTVVEYQTDLICRFLPDSTLTFVNQAYCRHHGKLREELLGHRFLLHVLQEDRERVSQHLASFNQKKPVATIEHRAVAAGAKVRWQEWINRPIFDEHGNITEFQAVGRDITERKRAVEALRESAVRFRALFENISSAVAVYKARNDGEDFVFVDFNRTGERVEQVERHNLIGRSVVEVFPGVKDFGLFEVFQRVWRTGEAEYLPISFYEDERIVGWRENYIYKLPSGEIVAMYDDVTERKQMEEALKESEERYRSLFERMPIGLYSTTPQGQILESNPALVEMLGYPNREALLTANVFDIYVDPDARRQEQILLQRAGAVTNTEHQLQRGDGTVIWVQDTVRVLQDAEGRTLRYEGSLEDITERKHAEREIEERRLYLEGVLACAPDAIVTLDDQHNILEWNPGAESIFGYTWQEAVGRNIDDLITGSDANVYAEAVRLTRMVMTGEGVPMVERVRYRKDGSPVNVITSGSPILIEEKVVGVVVAYTDITERKHLEQKLRQQERLAAVGQLAGGIAHDFNNMLTVVMLYAQKLLRHQLPADMVSDIETILDETKRATRLVGQILDYSRRSPMKTERINLKPFITEIISILQQTIPESIHIRLDVGAEELAAPLTVNADPTRLQQVLTNLLVNARDALPEGGEICIGLSRIEINPDEKPPVIDMVPGEWICLFVSDTGTGMPPNVMSHLFEPFFSTKRFGLGTGLGLAQVHGIVGQHGGHIGVETDMDQGTTFCVYLPAAGAMKAVAEAEDESAATPQGQGEVILFVEDNEHLLKGGEELLISLGYHVLTGANGLEAMEVYRTVKGIDLVITDLVMPEMGGKKMMQELGKIYPDLKVLALTGYTMEESLEELKEAGFLDVIFKPFRSDKLAQAIRRALDGD